MTFPQESLLKLVLAARKILQDNHPDEVKVLLKSVEGMMELQEAMVELDQARLG